MKTLKEIQMKAESLNLVVNEFMPYLLVEGTSKTQIDSLHGWCIENQIFCTDIDGGMAWQSDAEWEFQIDPNFQEGKQVDVMEVETAYLQKLTDQMTVLDLYRHIAVVMEAKNYTIEITEGNQAIVDFTNSRIDAKNLYDFLDFNGYTCSYAGGHLVSIDLDTFKQL